MLASRSSMEATRCPRQIPKATDAGAQVFVFFQSPVLNWYALQKSSRREFNKKRIEVFLAGPVIRFLSRMWDAELAGAIPSRPREHRKPIGAYD